MRQAILFAALAFAAAPAAAQQVVQGVGFVGSEAARYDERRDEYLVSNLGARGNASVDGFIARVAPDGNVRELRWIGRGLADPLGIFLHGDRLYVADISGSRLVSRLASTRSRSRH